mmetsp:Transcript_46331/g.92502  ORF Transcript_46331/g.92502 Transcript_46331/m.92502 type:complete len:93 (-) Transcript_46331:244-522(-)
MLVMRTGVVVHLSRRAAAWCDGVDAQWCARGTPWVLPHVHARGVYRPVAHGGFENTSLSGDGSLRPKAQLGSTVPFVACMSGALMSTSSRRW